VRALQAVEFGCGPAGARVCEVPEPKPDVDQVLIRVAAVSASHLDLGVLAGHFAGVAPPRTLGIDPAGTVVGVGADVDPVLLGATVVVKPNLFCGRCRFCLAGREADCLTQPILGVHVDGGAAELVAVPARSVFRVPEGVSPSAAAATVHTAPVALHMLRVACGPDLDLIGRSVLITGAAGAVGSATVQLVKALGGTAVAMVRGTGRVDVVSSLGADHVVDLDDPRAVAEIVEITGGGADVVVETTGDPQVAALAYAVLGWTGSLVTCTGSGSTLRVELGELYRNRRALHGTAGSDVVDVARSLALVGRGEIEPLVGTILALDDHATAFAGFTDRGRSGRIVFSLES
jgi:NADPH:quinone reductase-like Zn-dependent oxidoreductase